MKKVAVIGAGMAGLVSARELEKEGHQVTVFEKSNRVGGLWVYDPMVESDLLGLDPNREIVHSSVYKSLRVNIPRQLMCFSDYPFLTKDGGDSRSFPGHEEVLRYLEDFARDFGLYKFIRFGHEVLLVEPVDGAGKEWTVGWRTILGQVGQENFQAVVVCNGKYTEPKLADFPGRDSWPGTQLHSHNYRTPEPFKDKVVVVIGNGPSAWDIMTDICNVAKEVYQAKRPSTLKLFAVDFEKNETKWQKCPMIDHVLEDGKVVFEDKSSVCADVIIHCTGYNIHYPFLRTNGRVTVEDNCVGPLYKHTFPPSLAPGLSFVGLPWLAIPSMVCELQAKWIARVLSGKVNLPTEEEMTSSVQEFYHDLEISGIPKHHAHRLRQQKWEYENWLIAQMGDPPLEKWKEQLYFTVLGKIILSYGREFRDILDIDKMIYELEFSESSN